MKKKLLVLVFCFSTITNIFPQVPKSFNYQAVVRDANGNALTNHNVSFQFSILQDSSSGLLIYEENFMSKFTNPFGIINFDIGGGKVKSGNFNNIDWGNHKYFLKIELDPSGGSSYSLMGTSQLLCVPYALYAENGDQVVSLTGTGSTTISGTYPNFTIYNPKIIAGNGILISNDSIINILPDKQITLTGTGSTTITGNYPSFTINNNYQSIMSSNDTIYLKNGGFVKLPYSAGIGIGISGTSIQNTMPNAYHTGDALGSGNLTVVAIQGRPILSNPPPTQKQVLSWNGSSWAPSSTGNVTGIGVTNRIAYWTNANTISGDSILYWDNINKRLGIGNPNPIQQLDISGNFNFPNSSSVSGVIYKGANTFIHNNGTNNTFVGINSGNLSLAYNNAINLTGIGYCSLYSNTTGQYNSAYGSQALYNNTTGSQNLAIGYCALYSDTTGSYNTAFGNCALYKNSYSYNTAIGYYSLYQNTGGSHNTAVGYSSLVDNVYGQDNTAIGEESLYNNTNGNSNTGIGYYANVISNSLDNATVIGYGAIVDASNKVRIGNTAVTIIEGQVGFSSASDMRFKQNIKDISVGLDFVMKLRPIEYNTKIGDTRLNYGFIAQELLQLVGDNNTLVNIGGDEDKTLSVRHTDLIAPLVKAIQEQQSIILNLQNQIIENNKNNQQQINDLKVEIEKLKQLKFNK